MPPQAVAILGAEGEDLSKRFVHLNEEWDATGTGTGHGVGFGHVPAIDRWGVVFRSVTNPAKGEFRASVSQQDPANVADVELEAALDEQLVLAAINRSRYTWRPAEAIAGETGIDLNTIRRILETTAADIIVSPHQNKQGLRLYTTREHLVRTGGDVMQRFTDVDETS
jgi:hypothetical protein